jgi:hypothetical protein
MQEVMKAIDIHVLLYTRIVTLIAFIVQEIAHDLIDPCDNSPHMCHI